MILGTLVAAICLGILAQVLAERFHIPAILPLLVFGILGGPEGLKLFDPNALGAEWLEVLVHLGVAVILFEGGLTLDPRRLIEVGGPVRNLLSFGVVLSGSLAAGCAHLILGWNWPTAALFGAIMTVTGPTVIVPLLRHMIAPREVKTVLLTESLLIDPVGAVAAFLVLQWTERAGIPWRELVSEISVLALTGVVLGFAAGGLAKLVVRTRWVSGELRNLSILAVLMLCYALAEGQAEQSGILAAMIMGLTMSSGELPDLVSVKAFKGQLTMLIISMLFILLSGGIRVSLILDLGLGGIWMVVALIFLVRPLSVFLSVWPGQMGLKERIVLALTAPRGIVAAAVASLAARHLAAIGSEGAGGLEGMVYFAILATGFFATIMALILPKWLGYASDPSRQRIIMVGANALTEHLMGRLAAAGKSLAVIDSVRWRLERFRKLGVETIQGDARDVSTYEDAGVERDSLILAATTNDELNLLVADLVHEEFGIEHPAAVLKDPPEDVGKRTRGWLDLLGGKGVDSAAWQRLLESGKTVPFDLEIDQEHSQAFLKDLFREETGNLLRLVTWKNSSPSFSVHALEEGQVLSLLVAEGPVSKRIGEYLAERAQTSDEKADGKTGDSSSTEV